MRPLEVETNLTSLAGQSWPQGLALLSALILCSIIGLEREHRHKSAGLRTHTLVGVGAALFMLVSKYGFFDVLEPGTIMLDPSRVAAQIVSGVGFIGGGLIFVRRDAVKGLTTAAVVWVSAAVGTACGAGLWLLGAFVTAAHLLILYGYPPLLRWATRSFPKSAQLQISYLEAEGALRHVLTIATQRGYTVTEVSTQRRGTDLGAAQTTTDLLLGVTGRGDINDLAVELSEATGVVAVHVGDTDELSD